jgi:hypothetical protein
MTRWSPPDDDRDAERELAETEYALWRSELDSDEVNRLLDEARNDS